MRNKVNHIHMLGICGTGMGSLAGLLLEKGYTVTGSDENIYPPISTQLEDMGIIPMSGYNPDHLNPRPDLVVVGNVISRTNPEAIAVIERQIPYISMPQAVERFFLKGRESIVVTGTHGKTTTATIAAWLLESAGETPSFLIGGVGLNFGKGYRYADGRYFVIEGDEYDTAFFDKGPKFLHYRPKAVIIGAVEFDHADIYKDLGQIRDAFTKFVKIIPENGLCVANADSKTTREIIANANCRVVTYGFDKCADYKVEQGKYRHPCGSRDPANLNALDSRFRGNDMRVFYLRNNSERGKGILEFKSPLLGKHNVSNAVAAAVLLLELGFDQKTISSGLETFKGVKRRQEIRGNVRGITVIDDFAHHPTAIRETVDAVRERFPKGRLWAIFEPRSNTTRRKVFEKEMAPSFKNADISIIAGIFSPDKIPEADRLDPANIVREINGNGGKAYYIRETGEIIDFVAEGAATNDTILIMSNGAFENIHERLILALEER